MKKLSVILLLLGAAQAADAEPLLLDWTDGSTDSASETYGISVNSLFCQDREAPRTCELMVTRVVRYGTPCRLNIGSDHFKADGRILRVEWRAGKIIVELDQGVLSYKYELGLASWSTKDGARFYIVDDAKGFVTSKPFQGKPGRTDSLAIVSKRTPGELVAEKEDFELGCSIARVPAAKSNPR
jgi:hypothetical protein